jgi:hypothetical protein
MDSLITAAARALSAGDALGALNRVALRKDAPALALRGIAMAQLGDLVRARTLLKAAGRAFGPREALARARCAVAVAEIALFSRDLGKSAKLLEHAHSALLIHGDLSNADYAAILSARHHLLVGRVDEADSRLAAVDAKRLPPALTAVRALVAAGIAMRRLQAKKARHALLLARAAARQSGIQSLIAEVENVGLELDAPAAHLIARDQQRLLLLDDIESLLASPALIVDECRLVVREAGAIVSLERRPVLFALARSLAEAWPGDVPRGVLLQRAFRARHADESHRARLRVEIGRLRQGLRMHAEVTATKCGFRLSPLNAREVVVLARPVDEDHASVLALLADGEAWSSSALALALGTSQRTVQRALESLAAEGKVQSLGRARARRWMTPPVPGFPTSLLLPASLPGW